MISRKIWMEKTSISTLWFRDENNSVFQILSGKFGIESHLSNSHKTIFRTSETWKSSLKSHSTRLNKLSGLKEHFKEFSNSFHSDISNFGKIAFYKCKLKFFLSRVSKSYPRQKFRQLNFFTTQCGKVLPNAITFFTEKSTFFRQINVFTKELLKSWFHEFF